MKFTTRPFGALVLGLIALAPALLLAAQPAPTVILISVDGLASYYFNDPKAHMPTIRSMAQNGARAERMEASFPTVTWPNHTTLVTGVSPGRHGVIGNSYYDRKENKNVPLLPDPLFDKEQIVKVPTIYDVAQEAGLKTAGVSWPASRNAKHLDWQVPDVGEQELFDKYGTPSLMSELRAKGIPVEKQMEWAKSGNPGKAMRDHMYTRITEHILTAHKPNVLVLHLVSVDAFEHSNGRNSPEAYWACNDSDNRVREVMEAVKAAGMADRTTFFVVSDHGFINYTNNINVNVLLQKEGLVNIAGTKITDGKVHFLSQGGAGFLYIRDEANRDAISKQLVAKLKDVEGVETVIEQKDYAKFDQVLPSQDPRTPDLMIAAKDGYSFSDSPAPKDLITPSSPVKGNHGYNPKHPLMYASFVAWGAGVKSGVVIPEIRNVDVAPTMAAVLGLEMKNVEGRVLTEILKKR
jgi:predicted AlkP superfamily pyrophosphatase or phosphodiesterase